MTFCKHLMLSTIFIISFGKVTLGCDTNCEFPFSYRDYKFIQCKALRHNRPWCITNQTLYDSYSNYGSSNFNTSWKGWSECAKNCPEEEKTCSECLSKCTDYKSNYIDDVSGKKWKWCVTDQKSFDLSHQIVGWKYCTNNCSIENEHVLYIIVIVLLIFIVMLLIILGTLYYKLKHKNIDPIGKEASDQKNENLMLDNPLVNDEIGDENETNLEPNPNHPKTIFIHNPVKMNRNYGNRLTPYERKQQNTIRLLRHLSGDPDIFDPKIDVKGQEKVVPYNSKREIDRGNFTIDEMIGAGNFGAVYKGVLKGLYKANDKIPIAIKTVTSFDTNLELMAIEAFIGEIKIMSIVDPHLNLVNMIGSCTSDFSETNQLWLLIEYCHYGDLKNYLIVNKNNILNMKDENKDPSRILLQWSYDIAKGMQYLARRNIMHGDLAARNILLEDELLHSRRIVAKISDFGLSKHMYEEVKYKKESRVDVPWKWMALEYLEYGIFTTTSDVWSFAVLIWEMLSFGDMPYGFTPFDEVLEKLQSSYRLPCPEEAKEIQSWSPCNLYDKLSKICYAKDFANRASFTSVIDCIESELLLHEKFLHAQMNESYLQIRANNYLDRKRLKTF